MLAFTSLAILGVNQDTSSNDIVASEHGLRLVAIAAIAFCLLGAVVLFFCREKNVKDVTARGKKEQKSALEAESKEIRLIDKTPRAGAENMMIGFLHPKSTVGILTELCEPAK